MFSGSVFLSQKHMKKFQGDLVHPARKRRAHLLLEVEPDDFYDHQVYDGLLEGMAPASEANSARNIIARMPTTPRCRGLLGLIVERLIVFLPLTAGSPTTPR